MEFYIIASRPFLEKAVEGKLFFDEKEAHVYQQQLTNQYRKNPFIVYRVFVSEFSMQPCP